MYNNQAVATNTLSFLLGCRHPFNILENQHVKKGYMEFYFKGVLFKTSIYTQIIYITMLPCKRN